MICDFGLDLTTTYSSTSSKAKCFILIKSCWTCTSLDASNSPNINSTCISMTCMCVYETDREQDRQRTQHSEVGVCVKCHQSRTAESNIGFNSSRLGFQTWYPAVTHTLSAHSSSWLQHTHLHTRNCTNKWQHTHRHTWGWEKMGLCLFNV